MEQEELSIKCKRQLIRKFVKAIKQAFQNLGCYRLWPAEAAQIQAYSNTFLAAWFFEKYKEDPKKFWEGLKKLRVNHLYSLLYDVVVVGLKVAKGFENYPISQKEIVDFVAFISNTTYKKIQNDIFCVKGTHNVLSKGEISNIIKKTKWIKTDKETSKEPSKLSIAADSLDWSLYFDVFAIGGMVAHGPYRCKDGILMVKDWFDLNPPIWKIRNKYPKLLMYLIYKPIKDLRFDIMNHFTTKENMPEKLLKFSVICGRRTSNIEQIKKLTSYYNRLTIKQTQYINNLKPLDIITKGTEIGYYIYKDFFDYYKMDWRPPKKVYANIKRQGLKHWNRYKSKPSLATPQNVTIFDPRSDFVM